MGNRAGSVFDRYFLIHESSGSPVEITSAITVGRDVGTLTYPSDPELSRGHFRILRNGSLCLLEDLGSTNRTFLNGRAIDAHTHVPVSYGDKISAGLQSFRISHGPKLPEKNTKVQRAQPQPVDQKGTGPKQKALPFSTILQELLKPSEWKNRDWLALLCAALYLLVQGYLVFEPAFGHSRWPVSAVDPAALFDILLLSALLMLTSFGGSRGILINQNSRVQKIAIIAATVLYFVVFETPNYAWEQAARADIEKSCLSQKTRGPFECKVALQTAKKAGVTLRPKGVATVAGLIQDEEFIRAYIGKPKSGPKDQQKKAP